ncbi:MAG TPA: hypothetical protein VF064_04245 [Pyrinomonadaceae bacterium]
MDGEIDITPGLQCCLICEGEQHPERVQGEEGRLEQARVHPKTSTIFP